jgi:hypothetical protein
MTLKPSVVTLLAGRRPFACLQQFICLVLAWLEDVCNSFGTQKHGSANTCIQNLTYRRLYGSRVKSEAAQSKKMSPKLIPAGFRSQARETIQEIHGDTRQEIHDPFERFWLNLVKDKWRRCLWCWKWGMDVIEPLRTDDVASIQKHVARDCFLCKPCTRLDEPSWYPSARQQCIRALANGAIMPQAIRGTEDVLQIVSAFVIGCYVDIKRLGTDDDGYSYSA